MTAETKLMIGVVTADTKVAARVKAIADRLELQFHQWDSLEKVMDSPQPCSVILSQVPATIEKGPAMAEYAQAIRQFCPDSFVVCSISHTLDRETASFLKKSGANMILLEPEIFDSCKLDFVCNQMVGGQYVPFKSFDLKKGSAVDFDIYHLMPLRRKFLKIVPEGTVLEEGHLTKYKTVGELYIHRNAAGKFKDYVVRNTEKSAEGLAARCRAQYLALCESFNSLITLLTDQGEAGSFNEGEALLNKCKKLGTELAGVLGSFGNPFEIINNFAVNSIGPFDRAPAIVSYLCVYGLEMEFKKLDEMLLAGLLCDLGLVLLPWDLVRKAYSSGINSLSAEDRKKFENYPNVSIETVLGRKVALSEEIRMLISQVNERHDQKGFPNRPNDSKLKDPAMLIRFCKDLDAATCLGMGKARQDPAQARAKFVSEAVYNANNYGKSLCEKLFKTYMKNQSKPS